MEYNNISKSEYLGEFYHQMGKDNEELYKPHIESIIGECKRTIHKYALVDFYNDKCYAELKSRDCWSYNYEKTMIGFNKVINGFKMMESKKIRVFFFFAFHDGLYYWELTRDNYNKNGGDDEIARAGTFHRGEADFKDHYFIKMHFLTKVCSIGSEVPLDVCLNNIEFRETHKPKFYKKDSYSGVGCLLKFKK